MGTYRCVVCSKNYPVHSKYGTCPKCGERTDYISDLIPNVPDEPEQEEEFNAEAAQVYSWRFDILWGAGYDSMVAELLAHGPGDLHEMADAKKAGCTDRRALEIFL